VRARRLRSRLARGRVAFGGQLRGDAMTVSLANATATPLARVPRLALDAFRDLVIAAPARGRRVSALFGRPTESGLEMFVVLAVDAEGLLEVASPVVGGAVYPAMTPDCPEVHLFEREIAEQWHVSPLGHPWLKPVRFPTGQIGVTDFYRIEGDEVHEVAVGPV